MPSLLPLGFGLWPSPSSSREGGGVHIPPWGEPPSHHINSTFIQKPGEIHIHATDQLVQPMYIVTINLYWNKEVLGRLDITEKGYFVVCSKGCSSPPPLLSLIFCCIFLHFWFGSCWKYVARLCSVVYFKCENLLQLLL